MNYLQAVNKVMVRLREDQVGSVSETAYSALIGEFINEARGEVESAWNWATLRAEVFISSVPSVHIYDTTVDTSAVLLRDPENRQLPMAFCVSTDLQKQLVQVPIDWLDKQIILNGDSVTDTVPGHFALSASGGTWQVVLLEAPTQAVQYKFFFKIPQDELTVDDEEIFVPWRPVVAYASMLALNERGEEIGEPGSIAEQRYNKALGNAISLEAVQSSEQLVVEPE